MTRGDRSLPDPRGARARYERLAGQRAQLADARRRASERLEALQRRLDVAEEVDQALDWLSERLLGDVVGLLEEKLTIALREVLGQPLTLRATCRHLRGAAALELHVERDGHAEDILRGQGGSVANVLSVGLRLFALTTLDPAAHRRFLVLDEQDCWLRPELVPRLARIVRDAGRALGFQVLMISHHDVEAFAPYADRIYRLHPTADGVRAQALDPERASSGADLGAASAQEER